MPCFSRLSAVLSLILVFASIFFAYTSVIMGIPNVNAQARNISLVGLFQGWNSTNPSINVIQGDMTTLSLSSGDVQHLFYIDINRNGTPECPAEKCSADFPPDTSVQFTVDFAPDSYEYVCPYHATSMRGSFVVQGFRITSSPSSLRVVQGFSNTSTIIVTSVNDFAGVVDLSATVSPSGPIPTLNRTALPISSNGVQTLALNVSASGSTPVGTYNVDVTGTSDSVTATRTVATLVVPPDFDISANPTRLVIQLGSAKNSTITLSSLDSFSGDEALSSNTPPAGMIATLTTASVTLTSGGRANSTLDVSISPTFAQPGTYMVNVTGTSGPRMHTTTVTVVAGPDFDVSASPTALSLNPGSSDTSTITLTSLNNFTGTVNLSGSVPSDGPIFSITSSSVSLPEGGTAAAMLRVNASATIVASNYTVTVYAASGLLNHSSPVSVSVRDFGLTVSIANLTVQQGAPATVTLSLRSLNGFAGVVSLTTTASSSDLSLLLNVTTITFDDSGIEFAVLTINVASVLAGTYTVSITGTSGSLSRTVSLSITVQPSPSGANILPLIGGVAVTAIAFATAGLYYTRRRRVGGKTSDSQVRT